LFQTIFLCKHFFK